MAFQVNVWISLTCKTKSSIIFAENSSIVYKPFIVILLTFILTSSIVIPSVIWLTEDLCVVVIKDFSDNENQNNEEKELEDIGSEEKEIFYSCFDDLVSSFGINKPLALNFYITGNFVHFMDIQLPPPEGLV